MTINLQTGGYVAPQILPGARSADTPLVKKQEQVSVPSLGSNAEAPPLPAEQRRYDKVFKAAQSFFADVFVAVLVGVGAGETRGGAGAVNGCH